MATTLDFLVLNTYNTLTLGVADISVYDITIVSPTIEIVIPGGDTVSLPFTPNDFNVFNSTSLGLTPVGATLTPLPENENNDLKPYLQMKQGD